MKRLAVALAAGAAVSTLAYASASALAVDGGKLQAGSASVTCDGNGVKANWGLETDDNSVRNVKVTGIDAACVGADIFVKVDNRPVVKTAIAGETVSVPFASPYPTPESINSIKIWIEG